ncbi:hypothetical protein E2C01_041111 [Portunus trituberculatus]|uniref:Uncharacterized protein n=1 Tax=Portunus trituberculatus TaxID=210409 RepID=A0A5B7FPT3_PORTR|nr:hypothetical protein [Portunus trituberculatus]
MTEVYSETEASPFPPRDVLRLPGEKGENPNRRTGRRDGPMNHYWFRPGAGDRTGVEGGVRAKYEAAPTPRRPVAQVSSGHEASSGRQDGETGVQDVRRTREEKELRYSRL